MREAAETSSAQAVGFWSQISQVGGDLTHLAAALEWGGAVRRLCSSPVPGSYSCCWVF